MIELMKKGVLTGLGMLSLTRDKVEELALEMVEKGKLSQQEGERFVREVMEKAEDSKAALTSQVEQAVSLALDKMHLAKKEDMEELKREVQSLREELQNRN